MNKLTNAQKLRRKQDKDRLLLQRECKHKNLTGWHDITTTCEYSTTTIARYCEDCEKKMDEIEASKRNWWRE